MTVRKQPSTKFATGFQFFWFEADCLQHIPPCASACVRGQRITVGTAYRLPRFLCASNTQRQCYWSWHFQQFLAFQKWRGNQPLGIVIHAGCSIAPASWAACRCFHENIDFSSWANTASICVVCFSEWSTSLCYLHLHAIANNDSLKTRTMHWRNRSYLNWSPYRLKAQGRCSLVGSCQLRDSPAQGNQTKSSQKFQNISGSYFLTRWIVLC